MITFDMLYVPPYTLLDRWMAAHAMPGTARLTPLYDDVVEVLRGFLQAVPVDEDWYSDEYKAIADRLLRLSPETPASHFRKVGYFEGRKPFAPGWRGLTEPLQFADLKSRLRIIPTRGRLRVDIDRDDFKSVLVAMPVDPSSYRAAYPDVAEAIDNETLPSVTDHFVERGYFEGRFPFDVVVDEKWYVSRYGHVRIGLERGIAQSAQNHFVQVGYQEGCRPTPP
jgi:hypothetical protein